MSNNGRGTTNWQSCYDIHNPIAYTNNLQSNSQNSLNYVDQCIDLIRKLNIKLIAFDFDCTLVNTHTGGQWLDSAEKLAAFLRPCFRDLLPVLLKCDDLHTCVVTFSPQEQLIREVLKISMINVYDIDRLVNRIIIKGNSKEFVNKHGLEASYSNGKQLHLELCKELLNINIDNSNILLIDDDPSNIQLARENGHVGFQVPTNRSVELEHIVCFLREQLEYGQ